MATLASTDERNTDARKIPIMAQRFISARDELDSIFTSMEIIRDKYAPTDDEYIEVQGKITQGKTILQNMLNAH